MQDKEDEQFKMLKELIKANIEKFPGYIITDNGDVLYDYDPGNENPTMEQVDSKYNIYKDCYAYVKAVTNLNYVYSNILTNNTMQSYMDSYAYFSFNIMLPMVDSFFISINCINNAFIFIKSIIIIIY